MIKRKIRNEVQEALQHQAAVALIGPRQVGKTTLALEIKESYGGIYLDLESSEDRGRLASPTLFLESMADRLVILDEIHRVPEIFQELRGIIDRGRQKGKGTSRFLILGSASIDLLRQSGESLAGRISYINMTPLTVEEIPDEQKSLDNLWVRGGFPDSYLAPDDKRSFNLRKDFIRTYLERDVQLFGPRIPAETLERLWTMLSHKQGTLLNASDLGRALQISTQSVTRYIDLLVDLLLVRRLQPYYANTQKRLVKSPKVYVRDSGLLHALLAIDNMDNLCGHPVVGMSWEGFVIENILSNLPWRSHAFFYRTLVGAEIDLVIEHPDRSLWAIEIKRSLAPKLEKGFYFAQKDLNPSRTFVVYAGKDSYPITESIEAVSLHRMIKILEEC